MINIKFLATTISIASLLASSAIASDGTDIPLISTSSPIAAGAAGKFAVYGGAKGNDLFQTTTQTTIDEVAARLLERDCSSKEEYKRLDNDLARRRGWLAKKTKSEDAHKFGELLRIVSPDTQQMYYTPCNGKKYPEMAEVIGDSIVDLFTPLIGRAEQEKARRSGKNVNGLQIETRAQMRSFADVAYFFSMDECSQSLLKMGASVNDAQALNILELATFSQMLAMNFAESTGKSNEEMSAKLDSGELSVITIQHFVNDIPLTTIYALISVDPSLGGNGLSEASLQECKDSNCFMLGHTNRIYVERLRELIVLYWKSVLDWLNEDGEAVLKEQMGIFAWLKAQTMERERGSASLTEWETGAVYKSHKLQPALSSWKVVDEHALPLRLGRFLEEYMQELSLSAIADDSVSPAPKPTSGKKTAKRK